jgi:hypothetical protein
MQPADEPCSHHFLPLKTIRDLGACQRAALYGAGIGFLAALIKAFGPFHSVDRALPLALDIGVAVVAFALLCAAAALLRNLLVRRLQDMAR